MKAEDIRKISVVGFGTMGRQITQSFSQAGFDVFARDVNDGVLKAGLDTIRTGRFGLEKAVERGKLTREAADESLARIRVTTDLAEACRDADFVVEAAVENTDLKGRIFRELDELCHEDVVLATNTSTLSITEMGAMTKRPDKVIGMHFFNPAQVMRLVEVIRGLLTSDETLELTKALSAKMGKTPVVVRDSPGFATSRLGLALFQEASRVLEEGTASARDVDLAMRLGYGYPMGPFELVDIVGLDARLRNLEAMYRATGDPAWTPPLLLRQLVSTGYLGDPKVKAGSRGGYYEYFRLRRPAEEKQ